MTLNLFTLPAGTVCKRNGLPFTLARDTLIECSDETYGLLLRQPGADSFNPEPRVVSGTPADVQAAYDAQLRQEMARAKNELEKSLEFCRISNALFYQPTLAALSAKRSCRDDKAAQPAREERRRRDFVAPVAAVILGFAAALLLRSGGKG